MLAPPRGGLAVIIPARWGSTRFPGKVLAPLGGRPIVEWCYRAAVRAAVGDVAVATDDLKVLQAVRGFGGRAVLTSKKAASGTDRVWEAVGRLGWRPTWVVNLQGDEPLVTHRDLRSLAALLRRRPGADIATLVTPLTSRAKLLRPDVVKAAVGRDGRVLYFSRAPIPFERGAAARRFEHIGIYGFRAGSLRRFVSLPPSPLEKTEMLEQLRAMEDGMTIYAATVPARGVAIDTPGDLAAAEKLIKRTI
ncbi:MAG: 3-deoxy-manno-octulosonate cytidylyltransferase [Elusimicrobia bacterium]|nr:3-deoxy-manno-octulosonate cytidylyltransferase [Elusimicrobiota bacterium]